MTLLKKIAEAICLEQFGSEEYYGEARCCKVGGTEGCCAIDYETTAQAVLDVLERSKKKRLTPNEIIERNLVKEAAKVFKQKLDPIESNQISVIVYDFKDEMQFLVAEMASKMAVDAKKLRRLLKKQQLWTHGDVAKLEKAYPYWKKVAQKIDTPADGKLCSHCGANDSTVYRSFSDKARGLGHQDIVIERIRKCSTPYCNHRWRTCEISQSRFNELVEKESAYEK